MKKIVFILLLAATLCGAQTHTFLDDRSVANFNHNWGVVRMDTLHLKAGVDTLLLSGDRSGYNLIVQSISGAALLQLSGTWTHWWTVPDSECFRFGGGQLDTLFAKTGETDSSVVQVMWSAWN